MKPVEYRDLVYLHPPIPILISFPSVSGVYHLKVPGRMSLREGISSTIYVLPLKAASPKAPVRLQGTAQTYPIIRKLAYNQHTVLNFLATNPSQRSDFLPTPEGCPFHFSLSRVLGTDRTLDTIEKVQIDLLRELVVFQGLYSIESAL